MEADQADREHGNRATGDEAAELPRFPSRSRSGMQVTLTRAALISEKAISNVVLAAPRVAGCPRW